VNARIRILTDRLFAVLMVFDSVSYQFSLTRETGLPRGWSRMDYCYKEVELKTVRPHVRPLNC